MWKMKCEKMLSFKCCALVIDMTDKAENCQKVLTLDWEYDGSINFWKISWKNIQNIQKKFLKNSKNWCFHVVASNFKTN